jgi:hypothetical protein
MDHAHAESEILRRRLQELLLSHLWAAHIPVWPGEDRRKNGYRMTTWVIVRGALRTRFPAQTASTGKWTWGKCGSVVELSDPLNPIQECATPKSSEKLPAAPK